MFYCDACRKKHDWPESLRGPTSLGQCEVCKKKSVCHDVPSYALPAPSKKKKGE